MIADVVIAGGGPNGLMLACELALAGVRPLVLERLPEPSREPKANGLLGQVVTVLDRRGLYTPLSGHPGPPQPNTGYFMFGGLALDLGMLADSPVHALAVPQRRIVEVLEERAGELGVRIRRGHEVRAFQQDGDAVTVEAGGPDGAYRVRARYLVGADGAHSVVRKRSGIGFPGVSYDRTTTRTAHAAVPAGWVDPGSGVLTVPGHGPVRPFLPLRTEHGGFSYAPLPGGPPLVSTTEWDLPADGGPMTLAELQASIRRVLGADVPLDPPEGMDAPVLRRLSGGNTRMAERFRDGRVFLVGDAAHVFTAGGGPGLNLGMQDAVNLGWKLAARLRGGAPDGLLDTYEQERRPAAARMVTYARAQAALLAPGGDVTALRTLVGEFLGEQGVVQRLADLTAGTDVVYPMGGGAGHPLVGRCAPEMELRTAEGPVRLAEAAAGGRPLLLDLTGGAAAAGALAAWRGRVDTVTAAPPDADAGAGAGGGATALLLRPDGYVAWASESARPGPAELDALRAAAQRWFGTPAPAPV
ncbi:2-polyprenyl-6-methoxyphenol hydroxylase-like FAD-dependent oxidoreductase [Murinocardiopsis flavida]|uniref:2-polyprenyl-6-methoxyphenol hydroxylase-like FAD-dependent oxidoreductase n=1 Tax=Murinocardiopsis flavida TaxID=645275 RepID=A0A2P8DP23_9ACTN|nr:FAD-dependent monooxygenase [Murinocardiopsis flavida]PSK98966.1 2-polyprenyl-6-methoxyphenol hydroxylase-like FAD-dependent oxidoreductase [Murinocardiopsis flavida]